MFSKFAPFQIGTGGDENEYKVTAYLSLLLAQDPKVRDFEISLNDPKYGSFNDLVIKVQYEQNGSDSEQTVAIQFKHLHKGIPLNLKRFLKQRGDFSLSKYHKETEKKKIPEEVFVVLFTSRTFDKQNEKSTTKLKAEPKTEVIEIKEEKQPSVIRLINSYTCGEVYQFKVKEGQKNFEDFLNRLYICSSQEDVNEIETKLSEQFLYQTTYKDFVKFIEDWSKTERTFKLNKLTIISKFMEFVLWPYSVKLCKDISGQEILFDKMFSKFDVTIFEKFIPAIQGYDKKFIEAKVAKINLREKEKEEVNEKKAKEKHTEEKNIAWEAEKQYGLSKKTDVIKLLWHLNELPLIIKFDCPREILKKVLNLPKEENYGRRLVVFGKVEEEFERRIFRNLSDFSKDDLQQHIFKDSKINLNEKEWHVVDFARNNKELAKIVATEKIVDLILEKKPIYLGEDSSDPFPNIHRFVQNPIIRWEVLEDSSISDIFVISYKEDSKKWANNLRRKETVILSEDSCSVQKFQDVCTRHENKNVHHLGITDEKNLSWIATKGNVEKLKSYFSPEANEVVLDSNIFSNFTNKVNVLCAGPGMGKSVFMEFLKENCPEDLWPILINLREYAARFNSYPFDQTVEEIIGRNFKIKDLTSEIVELRKNRRALLLWDGLDDLPKCLHNKFLDSVKFLSKKGYLQWVTARNHLRNMLEQKLNVFVLTLTKFNENDQRCYIKHENQIIKQLTNYVGSDLLETPRQLLMLANICRDKTDFISLTDIYSRFVEMQFETFNRKTSDSRDILLQSQLKLLDRGFLPKYQIFGVSACFEKRILQKLKVDEQIQRHFLDEIKENGDKRGLVVGLTENDIPIFIHQSYAEYFCALYLKENIGQIGNFLSEELASKDKFQPIRYMLDMLLANESKSHLAVIYGNVDMLEKSEPLPTDLIGRTPPQLAFIYNHFGGYSILTQNDIRDTHEAEFDAAKWDANEKIRLAKIKNKHIYDFDKLEDFDIFRHCEEMRNLYPLEVLLKLNDSEENKIRIRNLDIYQKYICTYALHCTRNGFENLLLLVENLSSIKITTFWTFNNNLLHFVAAFVRKSAILTKLLAITDLDINARNSHNRTPLLEATLDVYGRPRQEIVKILLEKGAQIDPRDLLGQTALLMACRQGHAEIVQILAAKKAKLNKQNNAGDTPILLAAQGGHNDVVDILIKYGAELNVKNEHGDPLLLLAIELKFDKSIRDKLIEAGADVNAKDEFGNTPSLMLKYDELSDATGKSISENGNVDDNQNLRWESLLLRVSQKGDADVAENLIKKKETDVNARTLRGETSLLLASKHGHIKIVELLLQKKAYIDGQDENGDSPLLVAVKKGHFDVADILIRNNANPNVRNKEGDTPLLIICRSFFTKRTDMMVKLLTKADADVNAQGKDRNSPLIFAIMQKDKDLAVILMKAKGIDVNVKNKNGDTALMMIARNRLGDDNDIGTRLIEAKADVNLQNNNGDTPLIAASNRNNKGIVKPLIEAGADVNAKNKDGDTALIMTSRCCLSDDNYISRLLVAAGADVNARNNNNDTPLIAASKSNNKNIVKYLIERGADINAQNKDGETMSSKPDDDARTANASILPSKKIFQFLLRKHLLLKARYWRLTLAVVILPIILFSGVIYGRWKTDSFREANITTPISYKTYHENFLLSQLPGKMKLVYAPFHPVANKIIEVVQEKFQIPSEDIAGFNSKQQLLESYEKNLEEKPIAAVMFNCEDSYRLAYNLTISNKYVNWRPKKLFIREDDVSFGTSNYVNMGFTALQMVIDYAFIEATMKRDLNATISMQRFPYPPHKKPSKSERTFTELLPLITILSFLLVYPTTLYGIVDEKSNGIKEFMKLYGVKPSIMWIAWAFEAFVTNIFSIVAITVLLKLSWKDMPAILEHSNGYMLLILLFLYFIASLSFTFFVSTLCSGRGLATTAGIMISIISYIIPKELMENLESYGFSFSKFSKVLLGLLPNVSLYYGYSTVSSYEDEEVGIQWKNCFMPGDDGGLSIGEVYLTLVCGTIIFTSGTIYMDICKPGKFGIGQPLYLPITNLIKFFKKSTNDQSDVEMGVLMMTTNDNTDINEDLLQGEEDVAIKVEKLRKVYGPKVAVDDLDLSIKENSITILLGHNGAGKSTTISIITGYIEATSGFVKIKGLDITNNLEEIRRNIGLCTQDNVLFNYLTVQEHLRFFGQLKGVKGISSRITVLLDQFNLSAKKDALAGSLSGGMKRKLCFAIALVANPATLILDEPTSGMDTESRQDIWKCLLKIRKNTTIFMTTHYMEEADALADYVAIMENGQLRCFDTPLHLKRKYGEGYQLKVDRNNFKSDQHVESLIAVVAQVGGIVTSKGNLNNITFKLPVENKHNFTQVFQELEEKNICGMDLSLITLSDVFIKIQTNPHQDNKFKFSSLSPSPNATNCIIPLFLKRYFFLRRNSLRYLPRVLVALAMFLTAMFSFQVINQTRSYFPERALNLTLESYGMTEVYFGGPPQLRGTYEKIVQLHHSKPINSANVTDAIIRKGVENLSYYKENMVAAAELEMKDDFISLNAMYSSHALHSAPISLNLATNMIAKVFLGENYSISITHAPLGKKTSLSELPEASVMISWLILLPCGMLILFNNFIIFPFEELSTGFVHIQKTSGLKLTYYWIVNIISDMLLYIFKTAFVFLPAIIIDFVFFSSANYHPAEYGYLICVFIVYAFSSLPFTYLFAYGKSFAKSCALYTVASFLLGIIPATIVILLENTKKASTAKNLSIIFSMISPQYGLSYRCYKFANKYLKNLNWILMDMKTKSYVCSVEPNPCCLDEASSACSNYKSYFHAESIEAILLFSLVPSLLYFAILLLLPNPIEWIRHCFRRRRKAESEGSSSILEAVNIKKNYGPIKAVKGLTVHLKEGICYGLLGVNGAGKTTTFNMLTKNILLDDGFIRIRSNDEKNKWLSSKSSKYSRELGYCPQNNALNLRLSGKEVLLSVAFLRGYSWADSKKLAMDLLKAFDLERYADLECGHYSGGNKRKLSICVALTGSPKAILLDEPTCGMDLISQRDFWECMFKFKDNIPLILCSHSMQECEALCDEIAIMKEGSIQIEGSIIQLKNAKAKGYTVVFHLKSASKDDIARFKADLSELELFQDEHRQTIGYNIENEKLSDIFKSAEKKKKDNDFIKDYDIFSRPLQDVLSFYAE